jgi:hypothetical protein
MQIVYMTTPANLFHVLRRQMHRQFRKRKSSFMILIQIVSYTNIRTKPSSSSSPSHSFATRFQDQTLRNSLAPTLNSSGSSPTLSTRLELSRLLRRLTESFSALVRFGPACTSIAKRTRLTTWP